MDTPGLFAIYFKDLNWATQAQLLEFMGVKNDSELGWDKMPLGLVPKGEPIEIPEKES